MSNLSEKLQAAFSAKLGKMSRFKVVISSDLPAGQVVTVSEELTGGLLVYLDGILADPIETGSTIGSYTAVMSGGQTKITFAIPLKAGRIINVLGFK